MIDRLRDLEATLAMVRQDLEREDSALETQDLAEIQSSLLESATARLKA